MSRLTFSLRAPPERRLDLSGLVPQRLGGLSVAEIEMLPLSGGRRPIHVGDVFAVTAGETTDIVLDGSPFFDDVGRGLDGGSIQVEGDVGDGAATAMVSGRLVIAGSAGHRLGGPAPGATSGMEGGLVLVRGDTGDRTGDKMRRGTIVVHGSAGRATASRMIGGTVVALQSVGDEPGVLMRRGTIITAMAGVLLPTFVDCGTHDLVFIRLLGRLLAREGVLTEEQILGRVRRHAGDMAALGNGELLILHAD